MEKERPILELLEILQSNLHMYFSSGLCAAIATMKYYKVFTVQEAHNLLYILDNNKPRNTWYYRTFVKDAGFYWKIGNIKPRRRWIKRMIVRYQLK